ncbi:MAG: tRNA (adenosine(37)-N6)-threonylcarbamoyltransferase complex dimerization subunit type 1 TsaB [Lachnospiraceae bacterium]|nr:tRNA (adenosine(37)-N6)-threonylcarbamoyltransferase complex dimerization subunit type 1 TsaB [Lachnospiraceae bacterium]
MKLLAVDASGRVATVALCDGSGILAEYSVDYNKTHSQTLLPMIDEVLRITETDREALDGIVVSKGPGSFTGLRIGAATVKGLCNALGVKLCGISTLEMLAGNFLGEKGFVIPLMDARRNQVYSAIYDCSGREPVSVCEDKARSIEEITALANGLEGPKVLLGDGLEPNRDYLLGNLTGDFRFAPEHLNLQRAGSLLVLGKTAFEKGLFVSGEELEIEYLRMSQAERVRMEMAAGAEKNGKEQAEGSHA